MKRWKAVALIFLLLFVAVQIPFCARRLQLGAIDAQIKDANQNRLEIKNENYRQFTGVIHVHTRLGGHSAGDFEELIMAAQDNELDFVLLTEHPNPLFDTAKQTLNGTHAGVLFVGGNEVSSKQGDRFLLLPGDAEARKDTTRDTQELIDRQKSANGFVAITYPEKFNSWTAENYDGVEVYSLHTNAKNFPVVMTFFDYFWSFGAYPQLTMARNFVRPDENLKKFDELTSAGKKLTLFGAADAHSNIGVSFGDRANHDWLKIHIDPYKSVFKLIKLHIWLENGVELTRENLIEAIKRGHCYAAFDVFGNADGFNFYAENGGEKKISGDDIKLSGAVKLTARAPLKSRFVLFRNGERVYETAETTEMIFEAKDVGVYRVEVYLDSPKFARAPWIISNPIYVR